MSGGGKRRATNQISKDTFHRDEERSDDENVDLSAQPKRASAETLAKRKIIKPRGRLGAAGTSMPSSGFNFGAIGAPSADSSATTPFSFGVKTDTEAKPTNPFGGFNNKPSTSFAISSAAQQLEADKPNNAFGFLGGSSAPASLPSKPTAGSDNKKNSQLKALNSLFEASITKAFTANPIADFSAIIAKYQLYLEKINNNTVTLPEPKQAIGSVGSNAATFGSSITSGASAPTGAIIASRPEVIAVDPSDSESEDEQPKKEVKVEGPQFTTSAKLSFKGSSFTFNPADKRKEDSDSDSEDEIKIEGPKFEFGGAVKNNSFKFDGMKTNGFSFALPPSTIATDVAPTTTEVSATPVFTFGQKATPTEEKPAETPKNKVETPATSTTFNFGTTSTAAASAFTFGSKSTEAKPAEAKPFAFGSSVPAFGVTKTDEAKTAFAFGSGEKPTFETPAKEGETKAETPKFTFGSASAASFSTTPASNGAFSFSFNQSNTKPLEAAPAAGDDEVEEFTPKGDFKPVVQLTEKVATEETTGEEDEECLYTKRAKLMMINPETKAYDSRGLGELKVLRNPETKKARILVRADGSNRVLLNTMVVSSIKYDAMGKGHVKCPVFTPGGMDTYVIKVKTDDDAKALIAKLDEAKDA
ncbi:hypothetical protein BABINDRAFT_159029 [Babjeviella inositovora NRRL Y-12698]|uniref:RanBD1 domain-containing protein n=1 Tax=Babjeviella inositovora NRRL Y-12698 TaxID=984486 RepID=A0A1E3QXY5_9ASCO|nr:uncharacterized protein BABINDRAFT_159029 [Babjeviella inositovora NRRL Y-12698]ODQ82434.1 hypothetical protein BABINDRAFT_159029 [Babjeviella inositovora NRRL Y-12698]